MPSAIVAGAHHMDITAAGIIRASAAIIAQIGAPAEARLTERLQLGARNGPRWTSMTSPTSGGQAPPGQFLPSFASSFFSRLATPVAPRSRA
jgi:hypothetical protein